MKSEVKKKAIELRKRGLSYAEICSELGISKSTAWYWRLYDIPLNKKAESRLLSRSINGNRRSIKNRQRKIKSGEAGLLRSVKERLSRFSFDADLARISCALLYWCEGTKDPFTLKFTNSDPRLIGTFLTFFRRGFKIEENKLRVLMHLHEYHDEQKQKLFWSNITNIPLVQFSRTYIKPHTGKVKREGYPGCITISYGNRWLVFEIKSIWEQIAKNTGV